MTQESWNLKLFTLIMSATVQAKTPENLQKWGKEFKRHWKMQPKEGEFRIMGFGTYCEMVDNIDPRIRDYFEDELDDILDF